MDFELSDSQREIRAAVAALCARFGNDYWRSCDENTAYPDEFVSAMSEAGWLSALIPQEYGSAEQKRHYLPRIASGELRLQSIGVTEPDAGSETPRIKTFARREGDGYVINGQKIF